MYCSLADIYSVLRPLEESLSPLSDMTTSMHNLAAPHTNGRAVVALLYRNSHEQSRSSRYNPHSFTIYLLYASSAIKSRRLVVKDHRAVRATR